MNAPDPLAAAVTQGELDAEGRLLSADAPLLSLNRRAGGDLGQVLAVPQLATVARLARRLGIPVSRNVTVADDEVDLMLSVRAQPLNGGVRLELTGWREEPVWSQLGSLDQVQADFLRADAEWRWETDAALRLTLVSVDAGRHGIEPARLLGQPITALFAMDGAEGLVEALAHRKPFAGETARLRDSEAPVLLAATVRRDPAGRFGGFIGAARMAEPAGSPPVDSTPLSDQFTTGLDKALRRPLAQIIANADSINAATDGPVAQDYATYAADIANAGRHLLALVDDLVDLQAVERPDFVPAAEPIDLADVARRAAGLLAVRAADAAVMIERPAPSEAVGAIGDFRRALQILVNLIGNAVRYAPSGSIVLVSAAHEGASARVSVADEGKGIAPADQARVFEKFERVDPGEPGGNGLGLYIARRLARAMGGDLTLESTPGEGARFTLTLPADAPRHQDQH